MAEVQIKEMNQVHEAFLQDILAKPQTTLRELSAKYGYTQSWICVVLRSDAFRARLAELNGGVETTILGELKDRLVTLADLGVAKLATHIEQSEDPEFIRDTVDKVLGRLGYGVAGRGVPSIAAQQNNFFISKEDLAAARAEIVADRAALIPTQRSEELSRLAASVASQVEPAMLPTARVD